MSLDLTPIKERLANATPGEWEVGYRYHVQGASQCKCYEGYGPLVWQGVQRINGEMMLAHVHRRGTHMPFMNDGIFARDDELGGVHVADTDTMGDEDLDLIVNAPADLAALVAEVERLRQNIEKEIRAQVAADIWEYWDACGDLIDDRDSARQAIDAIAAQIAKGTDND